MKKPFKAILVVTIFLVIFLTSLWYFFPWQDAGVLAASRMGQQLSRKGVASGYGNVTSKGKFFPSIRLNDFIISTFAGGISFPYIHVRPLLSSTLLQGGPVLRVEFPQSSLKFTLGDMEDMEIEGSVVLKIKGKSLEMKEILIEGDVEVSGDISIDTTAGKILESGMTIRVPDKTETLMYSLDSFLPLKRISRGKWEMVRRGGD